MQGCTARSGSGGRDGDSRFMCANTTCHHSATIHKSDPWHSPASVSPAAHRSPHPKPLLFSIQPPGTTPHAQEHPISPSRAVGWVWGQNEQRYLP